MLNILSNNQINYRYIGFAQLTSRTLQKYLKRVYLHESLEKKLNDWMFYLGLSRSLGAYSILLQVIMNQHWPIIDPRLLELYEPLLKMGQGGYGQVWKVRNRQTSSICAIKRIHDAFRNSTDAQRAYRQIKYLQKLNHPNIINLVCFNLLENSKDIYLTLQFMEYDLTTAIRHGILKTLQKHFIFYQIANGVKYLHSAHLVHRDLKPSNILLNQNCQAKICDFGLIRSVMPSETNKELVMTENIATRWYRAPQILLCSNSYGKPVDVWGLGCVLAQIFLGRPLFQGSSAVGQLEKIFQIIGKPTRKELNFIRSEASKSIVESMKVQKKKSIKQIFQKEDKNLVDLLEKIFVVDPNHRITIEGIMIHPFVSLFHGVVEEIKCTETIKILYDDRHLTSDNYRTLLMNELEETSVWKKSQAERSVPSTYNDSVVTQSLPNNSRQQFFGNCDVFGRFNRFSPQRQAKNNQEIGFSNFQSTNIIHYVKKDSPEGSNRRQRQLKVEKLDNKQRQLDPTNLCRIKKLTTYPLMRLHSPDNRYSKPQGERSKSKSPSQKLNPQSIINLSLEKMQRIRRNIKDDKVFGRLCFQTNNLRPKNTIENNRFSPLRNYNKSLSPGSRFEKQATQISDEFTLPRAETTQVQIKRSRFVPSFIRNRAKYKSRSPESEAKSKLSGKRNDRDLNEQSCHQRPKQGRILSENFLKILSSNSRRSRKAIGSPYWCKEQRY